MNRKKDALLARIAVYNILIGTMYRAMVEQLAQLRESPATFPNGIDPWAATKRALAEKGWEEDRVTAAATRSQRSGLIVGHATYGGMIFSVSPMLTELGKTVDFDDALRREKNAWGDELPQGRLGKSSQLRGCRRRAPSRAIASMNPRCRPDLTKKAGPA